jgi:hypothetical protein
VLSVMGIFRLTRGLLDRAGSSRSRLGAWVAVVVFAANPNLIYLQATAMTESMYLAFFIWAVVYFAEFFGRLAAPASDATWRRPLYRCALCLAGAELTRYDGWFLATAIGLGVLVMLFRRWADRSFRVTAMKFLVYIAIAPVMWLAYNGAVYGNPLEFANGPYSAKAIEQRTAQPGYPSHPGAGNVITAASFFLKSAELDMAQGNWGRIWIVVMLLGSLVSVNLRARGAVALLWVPVLFYALSIAYSGVPLFLPAWWPFTWYNLRYGLQLLPLFAVSAALVVAAPEGVLRLAPSLKRWPDAKLLWHGSLAVAVVIVAFSYGFVWKAQPLCFKEAWINSRTKLALESSVAKVISDLPSGSRYLMYLGDHVGAFQQAGVPLRQVVNEGNHRTWKKPSDPQGLWERALADPGQYADYVIAYEGDALDRGVNKNGLRLWTEIHATGQPRARIYATRMGLNQSR